MGGYKMMMVMIMMRMIMIYGDDDYADGKYTVKVSELEEFI
jgi:hypothetical protein